MDRIIISSGNKKIMLPKSRSINVHYEPKYTEIAVASGKLVRDMLGFRKVISYSADYFPNDDLRVLLEMITSGEFLSVEYPDPTYGEDYGVFSVEPPTPTVFRYDQNGNGVWHDISLEMQSQEVFLHADD